MKRIRLSILAALLAIPLLACDFAVETVNLEIRDFDTSSVQGIALWQLDEQSGDWVRVQDIPLQREKASDGGDMLSYPIHLPGANVTPITWAAEVLRDAASDDVRVQLLVGRPAPGTYKVSARNASGDSPLSAEVLVIGSAG